MPVMLERWNDDKMDALAAKVDEHGTQLSEIRYELREQRKETRDGLDKLAEALCEERKETKAGFEKIDGRFEKIDGRFEKIDGRFEKIDGRFEKIDGRFEKLGDRLDRMQRMMVWAAVMISVALLGSSSAIIAALLNSSHP
jgi:predicted nuclease with TOPRIM domain